MDERGPLLYSDRHRERQQVLAGKWEIHNSVGSREKLYHEGGQTLGVQKAYGISILEDTQNSAAQGPEESALVGSTLSRTSRDPFSPK